jgi:hypothetical protein
LEKQAENHHIMFTKPPLLSSAFRSKILSDSGIFNEHANLAQAQLLYADEYYFIMLEGLTNYLLVEVRNGKYEILNIEDLNRELGPKELAQHFVPFMSAG